MKKTAVVLLNLGGPNNLDEVAPFLLSLFSDKAILGLPQPFRWGVAKLISGRRLGAAKAIYEELGGKSPLLNNTQAQAEALEVILGEGYRVFIAMRHAHPRTEVAVQQVAEYRPDEVVLLPLYPQHSTTTTASSFQEWSRLYPLETPTREVCCYPTGPGFIKGYADLITTSYFKASTQGQPRLLLTAHGLPEKTINRGDPYRFQVEQTAAALIKSLEIPSLDAGVCFQSRVGPMKWIQPYTDDEIKRASAAGRPLVVAPISFVSEHSETLVELDIEYRKLALDLGCPFYERVPALGTHPHYIEELAAQVLGGSCPQEPCIARCSQCWHHLQQKEAQVA